MNPQQRALRITLIVDNATPAGLVEEHGFAAWVEAGDQRIVFDTGQGLAFEHNARHLGIDLDQADALVLSHGHYDHSGGVGAFLAANSHAPVFSSRDTQVRRFSCHPDQPPRMIGIGEATLSALNALPVSRRIELDAPRYIGPGIGITGPVPRQTAFEDAGGPFFFDVAGRHPDPVGDDLALWFETTDGLLVLTGCCHSGIVNTVDYIRKITGITRMNSIVGGLHLLHASPQRLGQTLRFLHECTLKRLIPCHCTGARVVDRLAQELGAILTPGEAGQSYELGVLR